MGTVEKVLDTYVSIYVAIFFGALRICYLASWLLDCNTFVGFSDLDMFQKNIPDLRVCVSSELHEKLEEIIWAFRVECVPSSSIPISDIRGFKAPKCYLVICF